jgi:adenylylsulfate kinase-like enzyme
MTPNEGLKAFLAKRLANVQASFSKADREAHALRVAYVSKLFVKHGVAVILALEMIGSFTEVYMKCSLET